MNVLQTDCALEDVPSPKVTRTNSKKGKQLCYVALLSNFLFVVV